MNAGKIFAISFTINAMMGNGFSAAMGQSAVAMQKLNDKARIISMEQKQLNRVWHESQVKVKEIHAAMLRLAKQHDAGKISTAQYQAGMRRLNQELDKSCMTADKYRSHLQRLENEASKTKAAMQEIRNAQAAREAASAQLSAAAAGVGRAVSTVGLLGAPVLSAVQIAADFEAAMSKVKAITGATGTDFDALTAKARELGEKTQFSARQAAEAMSYLGMAGWDAEKIMKGMPGLLSLAAAGGADLARTADIVSDTLTAFGKKAEEAGHMSDVFAYTITKSNTNIELMGESMKYAAPVAKAFGATMEETAALIGIMGNAGIKGSQAGTSLRAGFLRLAGPPKKAASEMEELGINVSEATREMEETQAVLSSLGVEVDSSLPPQKKMVEIIRRLSDRTSELTEEQKLAALSAIFGTTAASGWLNVINAGPEELDKFIQALEECDGKADQVAKTMNDNAKGAATRLQSAMESVAISAGSIFLPTIANAVEWLAKCTGEMSRWISEHPKTISAITSLAGAILGGYVAFKLAAVGFEAYTFIMTGGLSTYITSSSLFCSLAKAAALAQWAWNAALSANPIGLVVAGIAALIGVGYLLYKNWDKVKEFFVKLWESPAAQIAAFMLFPIGPLIFIGAEIISHWDAVKTWFSTFLDDPSGHIDQFCAYVMAKFKELASYVMEKWERLKYALSNPLTATINLIEGKTVYGGETTSEYDGKSYDISRVNNDYLPGESATGGIFNRPYLTWVAEAGAPEAIVPLDGSQRAINLWGQAGQMLGLIPTAAPSLGGIPSMKAEEGRGVWGLARDFFSGSVSASNPAPVAPPISINLTFNGSTDASEVQAAVTEAAQTVQRSWAQEMAEFMREKERGSYA